MQATLPQRIDFRAAIIDPLGQSGLHIHLVLGGAPAGRFNSGARPWRAPGGAWWRLPEFPAGCHRAEPSTAPDPSAPECGKIPKARGLATSRRPPPARPPRGKAENQRTGYRRLTGPYAAWDDRK